MRYKDQNDIDYEKFRQISELSKEADDAEIAYNIFELFYKSKQYNEKQYKEFASALIEPTKFLYKIDLNFKTAGDFIDADTYFTDGDFLELAKKIVKRKYFWQRIKFSKATVEHAAMEFKKFVEPLKEQYIWIFNPPQFSFNNEITQGSEQRREFAEYYGGYKEMVYLLCSGDLTKSDIITSWELDVFLFQGEYMLRKKIVESIK